MTIPDVERDSMGRAVSWEAEYGRMFNAAVALDRNERKYQRAVTAAMGVILPYWQAAIDRKDYATSDRIREELGKGGIQLASTPTGGVDWRVELTTFGMDRLEQPQQR